MVMLLMMIQKLMAMLVMMKVTLVIRNRQLFLKPVVYYAAVQLYALLRFSPWG